jgi:hypothetical protein
MVCQKLISHETHFDLVHVGKCGGASASIELSRHGFRFDHVHLRRPQAAADRCYVVLVRDPIARFVSAFNWRRQLMLEGGFRGSEDPISRLRHDAERTLLNSFKDVNSFAEALVPRPGYDVSPILTMMQVIGHVPQGFAWYLDGLLDRITPTQLIGVVQMERFESDIERFFGFKPKARLHSNASSSVITLSELATTNLARVLALEYEALEKLSTLASSAGIPLSFQYRS